MFSAQIRKPGGLVRLAAFLAAVLVCFVASPALAQDYTITEVSGKYVEREGAGTTHSLSDDSFVSVDLPFDFFYYGRTWDKAFLHSNGFIQFKESAPRSSDFSNETFPSSGSDNDGMVAPLWDDLNPARSSSTVIATFATGSAPNRTFHFSWEAIAPYSGSGSYWFQVQLQEGNGRITFAYKAENSPSTWGSLGYSIGIEEPDRSGVRKTRSVSPNTSPNNSGHPGTDYQFDPAVTRFTGRVLADFPVADESGIGNSVAFSQPVAGIAVQLLDGSGQVAAEGGSDENGDFEVRGLALDSSGSGSLRMTTASPAATVGRTAAGPESFELTSSVAFGDDTDVGTFTISDTNDTDAAFRAPLFIAMQVQALADRYGDFTDPAVRPLTVLYDPAASQTTLYAERDESTAAQMRIGSAASGNEDAWDRSVITRTWARTFLDSLTGFEGTAHSPGLDVVSNTGNAFAEGFGAFLHAHFTEETTLVDATGAGSADTFDIETPELTNAESDAVAGWIAAALWDLRDGIDDLTPSETHDKVDGTADPDRVLTVLDAIVGQATPDLFTTAWDDAGHDSAALARVFIRHGAFADDDSEENDSRETAVAMGEVGSIIGGRVLNRFNADWFLTTVPQDTEGIQVIMSFDRFNVNADVLLEIRDAQTGALVVTGAAESSTDPFVAQTGFLTAGDYAIAITHLDGDRVPAYTLTTFGRLSVAGFELPDWTVNQPYSVDVPISGGVPPYSILIDSSFILPSGITLDGARSRVRGTPTRTGEFSILLTIRDSAVPANEVTSPQEFFINPELELGGAPVIGVPVGVPSEVAIQRSGGTPPYVAELGEGTLPDGLQLAATGPDLTGTLAEMGSHRVRIDLSDQAGASRVLSTTVVACTDVPNKKTPAPLGAGSSATGFWVDAVAGTEVTLKVKTSKKRAKRGLEAFVVDSDGNRVESGKIKGGKGKAQFKKVRVPQSGRFFLVVSSDAGEETQLEGTVKTKLPKKFSGGVEEFGAADAEQIEFGALAGAQLKFQAKADRSGLQVGVQALIAPSGAVVFGPQLGVTTKKTTVKFARELDESGTWRIVLIRTGGPPGSAKYKLKVKQPKGVDFSVE